MAEVAASGKIRSKRLDQDARIKQRGFAQNRAATFAASNNVGVDE